MDLRKFAFLMCVVASCTSLPVEDQVAPRTQVQLDNDIGMRLSSGFEKRFSVSKDIEVSIFLRSLAEKLIVYAKPIDQSPVGVFIVQEKPPSLRNYSLPGVRIYFSKELLKRLAHDSEIAAVIAVEIAHVQLRHVLRRSLKAESKSESSPSITLDPGSFDYNEADLTEAFRSAVRLLYQAGYDPRGLTSVLRIYKENSGMTTLTADYIRRAEDAVYEEIAHFTPLHHPIVRSDRFIAIQNRIKRL